MPPRRSAPAAAAAAQAGAGPAASAARRPAGAAPARPFVRSLLLVQHLAALLGARNHDALLATLAAAETESDGRWVDALLRAGTPLLPREDLERYDTGIRRHEARIGQARRGFRLTHFQWLAALATELHLDQLKRGTPAWVARIDAWRAEHASYLPSYTAADARKLAMFMATGSGKTLLLHVNLLQFLDHGLFTPDNILLLTPWESLSRQHAAELEQSGLDDLGVQITEITKLYVDAPGARRPRKGVSEATSRYEGPNLVLVDEGHKGGRGEAAGEREWRAIREALAAGATGDKAGFTLEYSATFAQIADEPSLYEEYAKCVAADFGYARFWRGGYGKDPRVVNTKNADDAERVLTAGLLSFYQQVRVAEEQQALAQLHGIAPPLAVFLGSKVTTGDSDVLTLLRFLSKAAHDTAFIAGAIATLDAWSRPAQAELSGDALDFRIVREKAAASSAAAVAADVQWRLFGGSGELELKLLSDKEIGLRSRGAPNDAYCGVVRVGEAARLLEALGKAGLFVGAPENMRDGLFGKIEDDARLRFLIGAKMFIEGWSSWRVSSLALMNVGRGAGAEVIQMFGRGVRLRGQGGSLKRSGTDAPAELKLLETLFVHGVRADYMQTYLGTLAREGMPDPRRFVLPLAEHEPAIDSLGLKTLAMDSEPFAQTVVFDAADGSPVVMTVGAGLSVSAGLDEARRLGAPLREFQPRAEWLGAEALYQAALALKRANGWNGLIVAPRQAVAAVERARVHAPADYFSQAATAAARQADLALSCLQRALAAAMRRAERRWRMDRVGTTDLTHENAGLPWVEVDGKRKLAYRLEVELGDAAAKGILDEVRRHVDGGSLSRQTLEIIRAALARDGALANVGDALEQLIDTWDPAQDTETGEAPLPRLYFDQHLFRPLLVQSPFETAGGQLDLLEARTGVRTSPPALTETEPRFAWDLRSYWQTHHKEQRWQGVSLYALRNPAAGGVTLFRAAGFAPDFMLWLKRGASQALAFVDPKGIALEWPQDKIELLVELGERSLSIPVRGWLVAGRSPEVAPVPDADFAAHRVLIMRGDRGYIDTILNELLALLP
jgi:hypothetical protein